MEVAYYILFLIAGIVGIVARILSSDGHSDLSRWVYCVAINLTVIGGFAWYQDKVWKKLEKNSPVVQGTSQSAPSADAPSVDPNNQHDKKPAAPVQDARLPHENLTPEYIEKILKQVAWEPRQIIAKQFIDESVTWAGRILSIYPEGDNPTITLKRELDANDPSWGLFSIRVKLPQNKRLLQLPKGSRLEIHGTIASFNSDIPELDDVTWKVLPSAATGN